MNFSPTVISTGVCTCASCGVGAAWKAAAEADSEALQKLSLFDSPRYGDRLVGTAKGFNIKSNPVRCGGILMNALDEALAKIDAKKLRSKRAGVFFGTSIGGIFETENAIISNFGKDCGGLRALSFYECSTLAEFVAKRTGAAGPCMAFSTACSSSSLALAAACNAIEQGWLDAAVVCGADSLSRITLNGFGSLLLLSKGKSKPFDACRDGINLGEAAGVMILCPRHCAEEFGAVPLAEISGWGCSADAYHPTAPLPSGEGAAYAMQKTLRKAGIDCGEISFYLSHGTGTVGNDSAEIPALKKVFPNAIPPFSSIKGIFGHTLGASGILNAIIAVKALEKSEIPACAGFEKRDSALGAEPVRKTFQKNLNSILTTSLGFGGNNSCAIVSRSLDECRKVVGRRRLFVFGGGALTPSASGSDIFDRECQNVEGSGKADISSLLKGIPMLKKRKWARLQQIGLQSAMSALDGVDVSCDARDVAVCIGTGLGMVSETARFVESTIAHRESEPLPTAFTNSVHNAVSSLISLRFGFKALNSAVTAKEISFECALWQVWCEINSGEAAAAVVGACDEYSDYAQMFLRSKRPEYLNRHPMRDFGAAYFVGEKSSCRSEPFAEILGIDLARREKNDSREIGAIENFLSGCGSASGKIDALIAPSAFSSKASSLISNMSAAMGNLETLMLDDFCGANYSASALSILAARHKFGRGFYLLYSPASTGMRGASIFRIL